MLEVAKPKQPPATPPVDHTQNDERSPTVEQNLHLQTGIQALKRELRHVERQLGTKLGAQDAALKSEEAQERADIHVLSQLLETLRAKQDEDIRSLRKTIAKQDREIQSLRSGLGDVQKQIKDAVLTLTTTSIDITPNRRHELTQKQTYQPHLHEHLKCGVRLGDCEYGQSVTPGGKYKTIDNDF